MVQMWVFVVGVFVAFLFGFFCAAMFSVGKDSDDRMKHIQKPEE